MCPQIYIACTPATTGERIALRDRALTLAACLRSLREPSASHVLLNFNAGAESAGQAIELLLLRPNAVLVGTIVPQHGPIEALPGGRWIQLDRSAALEQPAEPSPLTRVARQRDLVRSCLNSAAERLLNLSTTTPAFERTIGAVICEPNIHPNSHIALDINEHRQWLKVFGLDELPGVATMARIGVQLSIETMRTIVSALFGGCLWYDGSRFLFELAPPRFQLRVLSDDSASQSTTPLLEGENIIGRRRTAHHNEHRLILRGDDLISIDHARIMCSDDEQIILRDTSKNGTWVTGPEGAETHVRRAEQTLVPGTVLRVGMTRLRLELIGD